MNQHIGEFAALLTVLFWTITALAFESASKKVGSLVVNVIRLFFAFFFLTGLAWFYRGIAFPTDATGYQWIILSCSGIVGFVIGDYSLFKAFETLGARITMLIQALVPPVTAFLSWLVLKEMLSPYNFLGMTITLIGIGMVVLVKKDKSGSEGRHFMGFGLKFPLHGFLFALAGALGQSIGLVLSKMGMGEYNAFAASQIRVLTGAIAFGLIFTLLRRWPEVFSTLKNKIAMRGISIGAVFGPFLGVAFSLIAIQNTKAGIAATIMALVPVTIIFPAWMFFGDKPRPREIAGALIAVGGVALFFVL